ncbi:MAG: glycosyltransferase family 39 protein [Chloroflexota bacterium]
MHRRNLWIALLAILVIAFALRLWHLDTESVWHDEAWSIRAFRGPFTTPDDNTPFVYYLGGHLLQQAGAGESPLALRYISVLIGTLTTALALRLGRRWFRPGAALTAGLLTATSPLLGEYAQEVRAYVVVPLIALVLLDFADRLLAYRRKGKTVPPGLWAYGFAAQVIGLYTHNLTVPLIVWLNTALGVIWLLRLDFRRLWQWALLQIALILAYVPWLLTQSPSGTPLNTPPQPGLPLIADIWTGYFFPVPAQINDLILRLDGFDVLTPFLAFGIICLLLIVGAGAVVLRHRPDRDTDRLWLLGSHALLVPAFSTALMIAASIDFHPRYYIAAVPGTLLLITGAIGHLNRHLLPGRRWPGTAAYGALVVIALAFTAISLFQIRTRSTYQHDDFRGLAEYYATLPADAVILVPFDVERALQDYYAERLNIRAQFVNVPLYSDEQTAIEIINGLITEAKPRHVEFLTWFQLPADVRGMYPCLLGAAAAELDSPRFYFGLSTQTYQIEQPLFIQPIEAQPHFDGVTFTGAAYASGAGGTCVRTGWSLSETVDADLNTAVALRNPIGGEVARTDAPIARADNASTSDWERGDSGTAYALLTLPSNAPPLDYTLTFGVYSNLQPSGLDVLSADGSPAGRTAIIDDAVSARGPLARQFRASARIEDNAPGGRIETGRPLDVSLIAVDPTGDPVAITLAAVDGLWRLDQAVEAGPDGLLAWARFIVPPGNSGEAVLRANDMEIGRYTVVDVPRQFDAPDYAVAVDTALPGVGRLAGFTPPEAIRSGDPIPVTLIWQADTPEFTAPLTVFVQLIGPDGRVIAQSDSQPAAGARPTPGWVDGEYIIDPHTLRFNNGNYTGEARLITGLYDAENGFQRVETAFGMDFVELGTITVDAG